MKVSLGWVKEFVNLDGISVDTIMVRLTEATCEVESVTRLYEHVAQVKIAQIVAIKPHPASDKLQLVSINHGTKDAPQVLEIVCGAVVQLNDFVPFAPVGTVLPMIGQLTERAIKGVKSAGMLCSQAELDLGDDTSGLWRLNDLVDVGAVGHTLGSVLKIKSDICLDIDNKSITHRPDLWGITGLARELAAIFKRPFNNPYNAIWRNQWQVTGRGTNPITLSIKNSHCLGYAGISVDHVDAQAVSPLWMQIRLRTQGVKSHSLLVDVSQYVMLEMGMPTHFYDRSRIAGSTLQIKDMGANSSFITLDGKSYDLLQSDVMIHDQRKAQVLAGIMGGVDSMIQPTTTELFIESAVWVAGSLRKTSARIGLRTDASIRYEKSLDVHMIYDAMWRCFELIKQHTPQATLNGDVVSSHWAEYSPEMISVPLAQIRGLLGVPIKAEEAMAILQSLEYTTLLNKEVLEVYPPSFRNTKELLRVADIAEEVGRIYGYGRIVPMAPLWPLTPQTLSSRVLFERKVQDFFVLHAQSMEIFTHPLIGEALLEQAKWVQEDAQLKMISSTVVNHDRLRSSLVPSFLAVAQINARHYPMFKVFEFARVHSSVATGGYKEHNHVGAMFYSQSHNPFMELVNVTEKLVSYLNIPVKLVCSQADTPFLPHTWAGRHPLEVWHLEANGEVVGVIHSVHPSLMLHLKMKGHLALLQLNVTTFVDKPMNERLAYMPIVRYQSSRFDSTWVLTKGQVASDLLEKLTQAYAEKRVPTLQEWRFLDYFENKESGVRTVTVRVVFQKDNGTLSGDELKSYEEQVMQVLREAGYQLHRLTVEE